ncbi:MAG: hypothetical protein IPK33_16440 [Gemmatimonadetes bacterium]|nr:hypothetical protein [Gemmatimonadota bacterium]
MSWRNISDGYFKTSTIGAIAIAPSDANVIYVGSGEHAIRGQSSSYGDGVYKSTDQGKTWVNVGLAATRQISAVRVHPNNPDVVYVAAQGDRWKGTAERGIYRSTDGGKTWVQVLKGENATSGAGGLSMDPTNPRILYAAMWDHQRTPWMVRSGGPGGGIWKSTDGGDSWKRLTEGLPKLIGNLDVAVSPANPERVYAIIEAEKGAVSQRRRGEVVAPAERGSPDPDALMVLHGRHCRPAERRRGVGDERPRAEVDRRRADVCGGERDARRQPRLLDQPDQQQLRGERQRRRRLDLAGWREELEHAGQPADGAVLPRDGRRRLSVQALLGTAGQLVGDHPVALRRLHDHRARVEQRPGVRERQHRRERCRPALCLRGLLPGPHR